jgi:hypothetical protein
MALEDEQGVQQQPPPDGGGERPRFCRACGAPADATAVFCANCGTAIDPSGAAQAIHAGQVSANQTGLNFHRPTVRVVILLAVAPVAYELWWYWQLFAFTRRERFPRAKSFWYLLIPIYSIVVLFRQFDDLDQAATKAGVRSFSAGLPITLIIVSSLISLSGGRAGVGVGVALGTLLISAVLIAIVGAIVQPSANAYLEHTYPDAKPSGLTWGEVTAAVIGIVFVVLIMVGALSATSTSSSSPPYTTAPLYQLPPGWTTVPSPDRAFSIALPPGWKAITASGQVVIPGETTQLQAFVRQLQGELKSGGIAIAALDLSPQGKIRSARANVATNLLADDQPQTSGTAAQIARAVGAQTARSLSQVHVSTTAPPFTVAASDSALMTITGQASNHGHIIAVTAWILAAMANGTGVVLDMTVGTSVAGSYHAEFAAIGRSLRIPAQT